MVIFSSITKNEYECKFESFKLLYKFHQTPFGKCLIAITDTDEKVAYLAFVDGNEEEVLEALKKKWPMTVTLMDTENKTKGIIEKIFHRDTSQLDSVSVLMMGTEFQTNVWESLAKIPNGTITTYTKVAHEIKRPRAAYAVGTTCARNHIAYVIPCHRVKGMNGSNKYAWGIQRKEAILDFETEQKSPNLKLFLSKFAKNKLLSI